MCYVHNQWYDISCAILYFLSTGQSVVAPTTWTQTARAKAQILWGYVITEECYGKEHQDQ